VFASARELKDEIRYVRVHNQFSHKRFKGTKSAERMIAPVDRAKNE
jgi:hypothetical protein